MAPADSLCGSRGVGCCFAIPAALVPLMTFAYPLSRALRMFEIGLGLAFVYYFWRKRRPPQAEGEHLTPFEKCRVPHPSRFSKGGNSRS